MKDVELYDLFKVPDAAIIKELRKNISILATENGKLNAYILELETKIKNQKKSFNKEILSIQTKHTKECQELDNKVSKEERKEIKKELVYNEILSNLKAENTKLKKQFKNCKMSNNELYSLVAKLKNQIEEKTIN